MKSTGIVRKLDDLGRIVIPKELRKTMSMDKHQPLEIFTDNNGTIVLRKYEPGCMFCGSMGDTISFKGELICKECVKEIKS